MTSVIVQRSTIQEVFAILRDQSSSGVDPNGNEGLVFLCGRAAEDGLTLTAVITPHVRNDFGSVFVTAQEFGRAAKRARALGTQILCQIHSHPGDCCHHSDGDDRLVILPFEGMLSIVMPNYGQPDAPIERWGIHQFLDGSWRWCDAISVRQNFHIQVL